MDAHAVESGSIPARAGEPSTRRPCRTWHRVYPRACGGTLTAVAIAVAMSGLSPRVRGNPGRQPGRRRTRRSIPARAGEPTPDLSAAYLYRVYPRACGGTGHDWSRPDLGAGLSRACGGTQYGVHDVIRCLGLSPRVRGNQLIVGRIPSDVGSIPARAGEPKPRPSWQTHRRAYPRACGGTSRGRLCGYARRGLSPRVRGNPFRSSSPRWMCRSIPARAGEPRNTGCQP